MAIETLPLFENRHPLTDLILATMAEIDSLETQAGKLRPAVRTEIANLSRHLGGLVEAAELTLPEDQLAIIREADSR
jgi:hypothetical protein